MNSYNNKESSGFFDHNTDEGNNIVCGNKPRNSTALASTIEQVLNNLEIATPKIPNFYEATKTQICLPNSNAKTYDAGCFMRYSTTAFFADNQTTNIKHFLKQGGVSTKKKAIIVESWEVPLLF
ncbi:hypothetical protein K1719_024273 [Acacia pycnantha]|nr:hypothetical protein K1719_024273 [Acacia pycnantha]